ncbi:MAG: glycosyltransferase [Thermoplasmata archaeon]|nr:glycosyltransferase [Thermoplasmata archaeon]
MLRYARPRVGGPGLALFTHGSFLEEVHQAELRASGTWSPSAAYYERHWFDLAVGRRVFGRFDRWFVLTEGEGSDVRAFFGIPGERITVVGLYLTREFLEAAGAPPRPGPTSTRYICSVSRIDRRKNFGALLEALDGSGYRFVLAGQDRGGLAEVEAVARRHPGTRWEYLGTIPEAAKVALIRSADAVVLPSISEGVPTLALEALVLGRPVILAGVCYGPGGPGVLRCSPNSAELRRVLDSLATRPRFPPMSPQTVEQATDTFLAALGERPRGSGDA